MDHAPVDHVQPTPVMMMLAPEGATLRRAIAAAAFFPGSAGQAVLFALATFAISFLVRPLGGMVWGARGDRSGRRSVLAVTIIVMAGATFCVGLIPSYARVGFWAPLMLILLRMAQGFSTGGEYGGAAIFMAEYAPDDRRGLCGSFLEFGTLAGFSLGALLERHWRPLLVLSGLVIALNVVNYTLLSYMPTYLQRRIGLTMDEALIVPILGMLFMMVLLPFAGALSDRIGRKPLWRFSLVGLILSVVPLYKLMGTGFQGAILGFMALGLLYVAQLATISATFPALFPTPVRFAGFAVAYNVATSIFGGTAPAVGSMLISATGNALMPAYYMIAACVVGVVALHFMPETARVSLEDITDQDIAGMGDDTT